jgi:hypothetical protein
MTVQENLEQYIESYISHLKLDFEIAVKNWKPKVSELELQAVCGGLLSRQCIIGSLLIERYEYWDGLIGPLFLRAMIELTINLSWISLSPIPRSALFVSHGLGQSKLQLEHARNLESLSEIPIDAVTAKEVWLNSQRHEMFTDVNVGLWSDKTLEEMARECDIDNFYKLYRALSPAMHGSWDHVFQLFLTAENAPQIPNPTLTPQTMHLCAQQLDYTFLLFNKIAKQTHSSKPTMIFVRTLFR